jgi:hypothetical protein
VVMAIVDERNISHIPLNRANRLADMAVQAIRTVDAQSKAEFRELGQLHAKVVSLQSEKKAVEQQLKALEDQHKLLTFAEATNSVERYEAFSNVMRQMLQSLKLIIRDYKNGKTLEAMVSMFASDTVAAICRKQGSLLGVTFDSSNNQRSISSPRLFVLAMLLQKLVEKEKSPRLNLFIVREKIIQTVAAYLKHKLGDESDIVKSDTLDFFYTTIESMRKGRAYSEVQLNLLYRNLYIDDSKDAGMERLRKLIALLSKTESSCFKGTAKELKAKASEIVNADMFHRSEYLRGFWAARERLLDFDRLWGNANKFVDPNSDMAGLLDTIKYARPQQVKIPIRESSIQANDGVWDKKAESLEILVNELSSYDVEFVNGLLDEQNFPQDQLTTLKTCVKEDNAENAGINIGKGARKHIQQLGAILGKLKDRLKWDPSNQDEDGQTTMSVEDRAAESLTALQASYSEITKFDYGRIFSGTNKSLTTRVEEATSNYGAVPLQIKIRKLKRKLEDLERQGHESCVAEAESKYKEKKKLLKTINDAKLKKLQSQVSKAFEQYQKQEGISWGEKRAHKAKGMRYADEFKQELDDLVDFHEACQRLIDRLQNRKVLFLNGSFTSYLLKELFIDDKGVFHSAGFSDAQRLQLIEEYSNDRPEWRLFKGYSKEVGGSRAAVKTSAIEMLQHSGDEFNINQVASPEVLARKQAPEAPAFVSKLFAKPGSSRVHICDSSAGEERELGDSHEHVISQHLIQVRG